MNTFLLTQEIQEKQDQLIFFKGLTYTNSNNNKNFATALENAHGTSGHFWLGSLWRHRSNPHCLGGSNFLICICWFALVQISGRSYCGGFSIFKVTHVRQRTNSTSGLPAWLDLRIGIKAVSPFWESDLIEVMKFSGLEGESVGNLEGMEAGVGSVDLCFPLTPPVLLLHFPSDWIKTGLLSQRRC